MLAAVVPVSATVCVEKAEVLPSTNKAVDIVGQKNAALSYFSDMSSTCGISGGKARVAWGDYNNDGLDDMLLDSQLWKNNGDGTFSDMSATAGIGGVGGGGVWGDYNNDGNLDFYSCAHWNLATWTTARWDSLWKNNGDGTFSNVTVDAGNVYDLFNTEAAAWGDFNNDGFIDLYVTNFETQEGTAIGQPDFLYMNDGDGTFTDATTAAGVQAPAIIAEETWVGRGVNCGDFNNDGHMDIYVGNYRIAPNFLWVNDGTGKFTDQALQKGVMGLNPGQGYGHTMGAQWGDANNDLNLDLFVSNVKHSVYQHDESHLYLNYGPYQYNFEDKGHTNIGIPWKDYTSEPAWGDFDNDGDLDLMVCAFYNYYKASLYQNDGTGNFNDVTTSVNINAPNRWSSAWADYNNDGFLDIFLGNYGGDTNYDTKFYQNNPNGNHWFEVKLNGTDCNRAAIGARVYLVANGTTQMREVEGGKGTCTQNSLTQHFGTGSYGGLADLIVKWPCGRNEIARNISLDQKVTMTEGDNEPYVPVFENIYALPLSCALLAAIFITRARLPGKRRKNP